MIPVRNLLGQPVFHGGAGLLDQPQATALHRVQVGGHNLGDGVPKRLRLKRTANPATFGTRQQRVHVKLTSGQRAVVEVGGIVQAAGRPVLTHLHIEHLLGDRAALAALEYARVLNGVLQIEQHTRRRAEVALIHQHGAPAQQVTMPL